MLHAEERHPLKQGLKLNDFKIRQNPCVAEERHPLKQGLKLNDFKIRQNPCVAEERHPLKQGLKLIVLVLILWAIFS